MSWASRPEQGTSPRDCQHPLLQTYKFLSCLISGEKRHEVRKKPGGIWTENFLSTGVKQYMKSWSIMFRIQPLRRQVLHSMGVAGMGFGSKYSILPSCQTSQHTSRLAGCAVTFPPYQLVTGQTHPDPTTLLQPTKALEGAAPENSPPGGSYLDISGVLEMFLPHITHDVTSDREATESQNF